MCHVFKTFSTLMTHTVPFILPFLATFVNFWLWCNKINNFEQTMSYNQTKFQPIWPSNEAGRENLMLCHFCGKAFTWSFRQTQNTFIYLYLYETIDNLCPAVSQCNNL